MIAVLAILAVGAWFVRAPAQAPAYPPSTAILGIAWDFPNAVLHRAPGSDLWTSAWTANDSLFMAWGDGGGMFGSNTTCRTRFGVHRVTGTPPNLTFTNVWGCKADGTGCEGVTAHNAACDAPFGGAMPTIGVPDAMTAVGDTLYAFVGEPTATGVDRLAMSTDFAQSWTYASWAWSHNAGDFWPWSFVQFGRGYSGAPDAYVYVVGGRVGDATRVYLARAPQASVMTQGVWQWFTGTPAVPSWGALSSAKAIFTDPTSTADPIAGSGGTMQYFPVLGRYVFIHTFGSVQQMHVYDAPAPWGPWTTVYYNDSWGNYGTSVGLYWPFVAKYISADNRTFWLAFSAGSAPEDWDNYNLIRGTFTLSDGRPIPPTGFQVR